VEYLLPWVLSRVELLAVKCTFGRSSLSITFVEGRSGSQK
jgi:hypothetical protein